jgi:hypothetical protein
MGEWPPYTSAMHRWVPLVLCTVLAVASLGAAVASASSPNHETAALDGKLVSQGSLPAGWSAPRTEVVAETAATLHGVCVPQFEKVLGASYLAVELTRHGAARGAGISESLTWSSLPSTAAARQALIETLQCTADVEHAPPSPVYGYLVHGSHMAPSLGIGGVYASILLRQPVGPGESATEIEYFALRHGVNATLFAAVPAHESLPAYLGILHDALARL